MNKEFPVLSRFDLHMLPDCFQSSLEPCFLTTKGFLNIWNFIWTDASLLYNSFVMSVKKHVKFYDENTTTFYSQGFNVKSGGTLKEYSEEYLKETHEKYITKYFPSSR